MTLTVLDDRASAESLERALPVYVTVPGAYAVSRGVAQVVDQAAAAMDWPDAFIWDDLVVDYALPARQLRLLRVRLPIDDFILLDQLDHAGRCAIRSDRLLQFAKAGALASPTDTSGALRLLLRDPSYRVERLEAPMRFVGPSFDPTVLAAPPPAPSGRAGRIAAIVNYRDHAHVTIACLEHLARQTLRSALDVIVVDNQSVPEQRAAVEAALNRLFAGRPAVRVQHPVFNAPFNLSYQNNYAAVLSDADVLFMLNNDCLLLDPACLQLLADWAATPGVGSASARLVGDGARLITAGVNAARHPKAGDERVWECDQAYLSDIVRGTPAVSTACAAISRAAWFAAGGMDSAAFPTQYDDADLCLRMGKLGYRHLHVGTVSGFHQPGASEARTRQTVQNKLALLMSRHRLDTIVGAGPEFIPLRPAPPFDDGRAHAWIEFAACSRLAARAKAEAGPAARAAWERLDALSTPEGVPNGPVSAGMGRRQQRAFFKQVLEVCRAFLAETAGDSAGPDHGASLDLVSARLEAAGRSGGPE